MMRKTWVAFLGLILVVGLGALATGCNSNLDDEDESPNLLTVTAINPANACVDWDGEPIDEDGDGTVDGNFITPVTSDFTIASTLKNPSAASPFNDIVLESYSISYVLNGFPNPPSVSSGLAVEIPAGGTAKVGLTVVSAADIDAGLFPRGARGRATIRFQGEDLGGKPANVAAKMSIEVVDICQ